MLHTLSSRTVFFGLVALAIVSMLFARLYLQELLDLEACPLCMTQRVFVVLWGLFALAGALHNPPAWGRRVYAALVSTVDEQIGRLLDQVDGLVQRGRVLAEVRPQ